MYNNQAISKHSNLKKQSLATIGHSGHVYKTQDALVRFFPAVHLNWLITWNSVERLLL